jgi:hypothetical protein
LFDDVQREAVERLSKTDMDIDKAASDLKFGEEDSSCTIHDLLLGSLLYGGIRKEPSGPDDRASMSPVASPNFQGAKRLLERAFEKGYTMAAVQIGSFYIQEEKLAAGKNLNGDPKELAFEWYKKAADLGNPVMHHFFNLLKFNAFYMYIYILILIFITLRWPVIRLVSFMKTLLEVKRASRTLSSTMKRALNKVSYL